MRNGGFVVELKKPLKLGGPRLSLPQNSCSSRKQSLYIWLRISGESFRSTHEFFFFAMFAPPPRGISNWPATWPISSTWPRCAAELRVLIGVAKRDGKGMWLLVGRSCKDQKGLGPSLAKVQEVSVYCWIILAEGEIIIAAS